MAWEDDVLASYEEKRAKQERKDWLTSQRNDLLESGHQRAWNLLRLDISKLCINLNEKSGREILKSTDPQSNSLNIVPEDGQCLKATYDPRNKVATFESDAMSFTQRIYKLAVETVDGNDTVVWFTSDKKPIPNPEDIARALVKSFMEAGRY